MELAACLVGRLDRFGMGNGNVLRTPPLRWQDVRFGKINYALQPMGNVHFRHWPHDAPIQPPGPSTKSARRP
jgi:hypothetical protein